jgi:DNA-directed RNA polymerase subunit RPC12/RpoP
MVYKYTKNSAGEYVCNLCGETREKQNTMHYHYKTHDEKKEYKCTKCSKEFISKQGLEKHNISKHDAPTELYSCTKCDFQNSAKGNCRIHYVRIHYKKEVEKILEKCDEGFKCLVCVNTFKGATSYYYHAFDCLKLVIAKT